MMTIEDFCRASFLQKRLKMIEEESCRDVFDEIFDRDLRSNSGPRSGCCSGILSQTEYC